MLLIPLAAVPNQIRSVVLNNQEFSLTIYQKSTGMFMDIASDLAPNPLVGVLCRNQCYCIMNAYFGFIGDFMWVDTWGANADPVYTGLGNSAARFQLVYLFPSDIPSSALFAGEESAEINPSPFS